MELPAHVHAIRGGAIRRVAIVAGSRAQLVWRAPRTSKRLMATGAPEATRVASYVVPCPPSPRMPWTA